MEADGQLQAIEMSEFSFRALLQIATYDSILNPLILDALNFTR